MLAACCGARRDGRLQGANLQLPPLAPSRPAPPCRHGNSRVVSRDCVNTSVVPRASPQADEKELKREAAQRRKQAREERNVKAAADGGEGQGDCGGEPIVDSAGATPSKKRRAASPDNAATTQGPRRARVRGGAAKPAVEGRDRI